MIHGSNTDLYSSRGYPLPSGSRSYFTGKERDAETGLDYFWARYLSSPQGRFTSVDPDINLGLHLTDPQGWNGYAYARNNPLLFVDPDGRDYRVCEIDGNGKEFNCGVVNDDRAFSQYAQKMGWKINRGKLIDKNGNVVGAAHWFSPEAMETISLAGQLAAPAGELLTAGMRAFGYIAAPQAMAIADYVSGANRSGVNLAMAIIPPQILEGATLFKTTYRAIQYEKAGGFAQALRDFESLEGPSRTIGEVRVKDLSDGSKAVAREFSSGGKPTLEFQPPSGPRTKIRYNQ